MNDLKRITIEELRECYVVVYTQEEVDLLRKLGVDSIITYRNGGMCIGPMLNNDNATLGTPCSLTYLRSLLDDIDATLT